LNYYSKHIGDFRAGTVNMSRLARWIYGDMIDVVYDTEKPLPLDLELLCDMLGVEADNERALVERILRLKFERQDDGYHHARCDREIAEFHLKAEVARTNGKAGGRPRKANANPEKPSGFIQVSESNPVETGSEANQEPITNNQEPVEQKTPPAVRVPSLSVSDLEAKGVATQTAAEFLAIRKRKRAPLTEIAMAGIARETAAAGWNLESALKKCIERGWTSFEASWVLGRADGTNGAKKPVDMRDEYGIPL
jgi:uncharacterized protein YdaU (DUF1376 family)